MLTHATANILLSAFEPSLRLAASHTVDGRTPFAPPFRNPAMPIPP